MFRTSTHIPSPETCSSPGQYLVPLTKATTSTVATPAAPISSAPFARDYLPFRFGFEAEILIRPRDITQLDPRLHLPECNGPGRETRQFNFSLLQIIAKLLSGNGMPAVVFDQSEEDSADYSKWNVMLDASLSKAHLKDGFCKFP